jgi:hypothetical protein
MTEIIIDKKINIIYIYFPNLIINLIYISMYGIVKKVKNGDILTKEEEQELFTLPPEERKEILLNYLSKQYYLKDDTKLFDLPPNERIEVLLRYMMNCKYDDGYHHSYILSDAAILKMFDLPKKEKLEILST